ncbi:MAG: hypothetical protein OXQ29_16090 [Rhodospirillaceae bacterium]|nr:hypothetical protein [Rhodospirillaceae bacterium]
MNKPCLTRFAALAACLLVTMWASPSTALTPCQELVMAGYQWGAGKIGDPIKPVNVGGSGGSTLTVTWEIPSGRPARTVAGQCVHLRHISTGEEAEHCDSVTRTTVNISGTECLGWREELQKNHCRYGNYSAKVRMRNNCSVDERWSDSINIRR